MSSSANSSSQPAVPPLSERAVVRVLIIVHVFPPEHAPAGIMVRELAEDLVRGGHSVTVLTGFPHHPLGVLFPGWEARFRRGGQEPGGYRLVRCGHSIRPGKGFAARLWYYLTFAVSTLANGLLEKRFDVVVCLSTPIFGSWSARILASLRGARFVYDIFDLHPEAARHAGLLSERSGAYRLWRAMDTLLCRSSHALVTLSEGMKREICLRGIPETKVRVISFWIDPDRILPGNRSNPWRKRQGIPDTVFVALFAGTVGFVSGAGVLVDVARHLAGRKDILLLVVGEGPVLPELQSSAKAAGLTNLRFLPFQSEADLPDMQATADVGLVTLLPDAGRSSVPSKVLGYLAAGRPVIASVHAESETAGMIREGECGQVVSPQDADALAAAIERAADNQLDNAGAGQRARQFFLRRYGRPSCTALYRELLLEIAGRA